ncbi:acetyl-coenzyme-A carboxylase [Malassezia cuniculi]|uniref:Acetyl-coenzyme-A carboxylase n=1 Tax=Malassezia cuniculi TaxID=948313 RepID=A0AAF0ERU9_9BASI|nr:acetyl-coenzyme-A carboxylase [Malassezia cuniculi]
MELPKVDGHFYGGNSILDAPPGPVADFVRRHGGHSVISKVLICNNGIAAVKEIRSVRKWAYETFGDERAIQFIVMATPEDLSVNAEYIRMADHYVEVPGGSNNHNYANVDLIVDIAERVGAHAVWAGWGHASENPRLPESLAASPQRILFLGPPGSAMRSLGDKISSTIVAQHADVPCLPWSGSGITETVVGSGGYVTVEDDVYQRACVHSAAEGLEVAQRIGFPVMIKASEGGGGKGIRKCSEPESFVRLYNAAVGEVPGSPIFIMKLAGQARHLEVQLLADQYGNAISIFGRDCSVQRRHQKIIEEAPVTVAPPSACAAMESAAVRLAKLVGYVSAGTVEWLYSPDTNEFSFLELNPRLQVEHPTTEMVSGVNIPAAQLMIAMGIPLHHVPDIRALYRYPRDGTEAIAFDDPPPEHRPVPSGHVIACRITAENPDTGFKPGIGALSELTFRSSTSTWGYFSVSGSGALHEYADSQFGHIFSFGTDRDDARKHMVFALKELSIRGDFCTTVEYLVQLLEMDAFRKNLITTAWLDGLIEQKLTAVRPERDLAVVCGAVVKAHVQLRECVEEYKRILHRGQVPPRSALSTVYPVEFIYDKQKYQFVARRCAADGWRLELNGTNTLVQVRELSDGGLLIGLANHSYTVYFRDEVGQTRLLIDGRTCLIEEENDPTQICTPSPGKLVRLLAESGDHVVGGQPIAEIEVMKMYLPLVAQESGIIKFVRSPGVSLSPGDLLGVLELDDPSKVLRAAPFTGRLQDYGSPVMIGARAHQRYEHVRRVLYDVLDGYDQEPDMFDALREFMQVVQQDELPYGQFEYMLASLSGRVPGALEDMVRATIRTAKEADRPFPARELHEECNAYLETLDAATATALRDTLAPAAAIVVAHSRGLREYMIDELCGLLRAYYDVEKQFPGEADAVLRIRAAVDGDLSRVAALQVSHMGIARKNALIVWLCDTYIRHSDMVSTTDPTQRIVAALRDLTLLPGPKAAPVALKAREILLIAELPSAWEREQEMEALLRKSVASSPKDAEVFAPSIDILRSLSDNRANLFDVLHTFFAHPDRYIAYAALMTYILRAYRAYEIVTFNFAPMSEDTRALITWHFQMSSAVLQDRAKDKERQASVTDLANCHRRRTHPKLRLGAMTSCARIADLPRTLANALQYFGDRPGEPVNVLNVAVTDEEFVTDIDVLPQVACVIDAMRVALNTARLRRATIMLCKRGQYPLFATYRRDEADEWNLQRSIQNVEPALAYQLELDRISRHYSVTPVPISTANLHMYFARGLRNKLDTRFFVRALIRPGTVQHDIAAYVLTECDRILHDVFSALQVASGRAEYRGADASHIFMSFLYPMPFTLAEMHASLAEFAERYGPRCAALHVSEAEVRVVIEDKGRLRPLRLFFSTETTFSLRAELYEEVVGNDGSTVLAAIPPTPETATHNGQSAHKAYPTRMALQVRRSRAHALGTTFVYDYIDALRKSLLKVWAGQPNAPSNALLKATELDLDGEELVEVERGPGENRFGMVGWSLQLRTPECPDGRPLLLVANDMTTQAGSFGPAEDKFFAAVSRLARTTGTPLLYISSNSGARIGLAGEPLGLFRAKFVDNDPSRGFEYLYLDDMSLATLDASAPGCVITQPKEAEDGTTHHVITDIIGASRDGLGVECLSGSGLIAGEMSRAREAVFTTTIITGRSVGIGAYLARLGGRVIQVESSPMILTGYQALNKLLGREVYTSNLQLGGPQIMYRNGVAHITAPSDADALCEYLSWLSYVPPTSGAPLPIMPSLDPVDRDVAFAPTPGIPYDPRHLICGTTDADGTFRPGLFDRGSFRETLAGWATSVVVGRARLGGIPFGVIAVETRTLERVVPADPANPNSNELRIMEAGQVWYPNSAYKTAQAIFDFNREGLPLMILANWRGFSGGQQDMYDEILKQGSKIVDGLSSYRQPVFVHIPPAGELRGGSWVVVDSAVNANGMIEMSADLHSARGGVLEASGLVEIKFRADKQRATMERLDPVYARLAAEARDAPDHLRAAALASLAERERLLSPFFVAIATEYVDAHDRAGRMLATGVLRRAMPWADTRRYFYWRTRRRLGEARAFGALRAADPSLSAADATAAVAEAAGYAPDLDDDEAAVAHLDRHADALSSAIEHAKVRHLAAQIAALDPALRRSLVAAVERET